MSDLNITLMKKMGSVSSLQESRLAEKVGEKDVLQIQSQSTEYKRYLRVEHRKVLYPDGRIVDWYGG